MEIPKFIITQNDFRNNLFLDGWQINFVSLTLKKSWYQVHSL